MKISDEQLVAFLDRELSQSEMHEIQTAIEASSELATRLNKFQNTDKWLSEAFKNTDTATLREDTHSLAEQLAEKLGTSEATSTSTVVEFAAAKTRGKYVAWPSYSRQAIAASLMLFLGFGAGLLINEGPQNGVSESAAYQIAGLMREGTPLYTALEFNPSVVSHKYGPQGNFSAVPVSTFKSRDGRYCREFVVSSPQANQQGIACRSGNGWIVQATIAANKQNTIVAEGYIPATPEENVVIDTWISGMLSGDILSSKQENKLLKERWKSE